MFIKKFLLSSGIAISLIVSGCIPKQSQVYLPPHVPAEKQNCITSVKTYLETAKKTKQVKNYAKAGKVVFVYYIGRLEDGTVFDTNIESVAKACGVYNPQRDYSTGLMFTIGAGQMIAGFESAVLGMKQGQTKTAKIPAEQAYGKRDSGYVVSIPKNTFSGVDSIKPGDKIQTSMGQVFTVYQIEKDTILVDTNHPLAGKDLIFDVTLSALQ